MAICNMVVQQVLGRECLWTILARVDEQSRKVNIFNVLPQIGLVGTDFSTEGAFECLLSIFQVADNIIVKSLVATSGVNKKPKKFKTVWHGVRGILKLSGRVNQASLKLSAGFSNTVC